MKLGLLVFRDTVLPTICNIIIAFAIVYIQTKNGVSVPPFATFESTVINIFAGNFMPITIMAIVGTFLTRKAVRDGVIQSFSNKFNYSNFLVRGFIVGVIFSLIFILITAFIFNSLFSDLTSRWDMIKLLCIDAMLIGLIFNPINIWIELNTATKS